MEANVWVVLGVFLALLIVAAIATNKKKKAQATAMGASSFSSGVVLHGIPHVPAQTGVDVFVANEKLTFKTNALTFDLPFDKVSAATALKTTDLLTKDKSVLARGIVGGVLLGPLGAIVGGMSGIGKKQLKGAFLVINYQQNNSDETDVIILNLYYMPNAKSIADDITKRLVNKKMINGTIEL